MAIDADLGSACIAVSIATSAGTTGLLRVLGEIHKRRRRMQRGG